MYAESGIGRLLGAVRSFCEVGRLDCVFIGFITSVGWKAEYEYEYSRSRVDEDEEHARLIQIPFSRSLHYSTVDQAACGMLECLDVGMSSARSLHKWL